MDEKLLEEGLKIVSTYEERGIKIVSTIEPQKNHPGEDKPNSGNEK